MVRFGLFFVALLLLVAAQWRWPARRDGRPARRQLVNFGLVLVDTALLRVAFPVLAVAWSITMHGRGLFGWLDWPAWLALPVAVLLLDVAIYWQHRCPDVQMLLKWALPIPRTSLTLS